jgi:hypothetical protein
MRLCEASEGSSKASTRIREIPPGKKARNEQILVLLVLLVHRLGLVSTIALCLCLILRSWGKTARPPGLASFKPPSQYLKIMARLQRIKLASILRYIPGSVSIAIQEGRYMWLYNHCGTFKHAYSVLMKNNTNNFLGSFILSLFEDLLVL